MLAGGQGQRQYKIFGIGLARAKIQQPAKCNGQHKQIDQQQIQRKHPDGAAQVGLAHVFHHHDLELSRQEHHREHRQHRQPEPLRPGKLAALLQAQQLAQFWHGLRAGEQVFQAIKQAVDDKETHGQECHQLDHRLKRNGRHHAFVPLGGVEVPRSKHHRKTGQNQRYIKGAVLAPVQGQRCRGTVCGGEQGVPRRHRLELQGDVGHDAHHGDQCHQAREQRALAVAARNEVGNGGDAVRFCNAHHLAQNHPAQNHDQCGSEVDGQKPDAARCRAPHTAKVGPGRAVHRQRKRVNPGVGNDGAALLRTAIGPIRNCKQQQQVGKGGRDNQKRRQHG